MTPGEGWERLPRARRGMLPLKPGMADIHTSHKHIVVKDMARTAQSIHEISGGLWKSAAPAGCLV